jgi:hypothetical protein
MLEAERIASRFRLPPWRLPPLGPRAVFARCFAIALRNKRDAVAALAAVGAIAAILVNGLFLQAGPHPAPIFAARPLISGEATGAIAQLPRPRPAAAAAAAAVAVGGVASRDSPRGDGIPVPRARRQAPPPPARADPIADLLDPARKVSALQGVLNDFGYGPIKVTGALDQPTAKGIERFERDHNLAVTGRNSPELRRALAAATGQPLD